MDKENAPKYSAVYKLTLVGESGVGKSSMLSRFADDKCLTSHIATIGVDFKVRTLMLDNELVKLQLW